MFTISRPTLLTAAAGGTLWTLKAAVITARDGSFEPLESYVFVGGLLAIVTAGVLLALDVGRRWSGSARVAATVAGFVACVIATGILESLGDAAIGGLSAGGNLGLEQEGGILLVGLGWLTAAMVAARSRTRPSGSRGTALRSDGVPS